MAVTKARDNDKPVDLNDPSKGASGGGAPEGYGILRDANVVEGVAERGEEGDAKRFEAAQKFADEKKKVEEEGPQYDAVQAQAKEANKKPTAPGANVAALDSDRALAPQQTEKLEKADVATSESAASQAKGETEKGEQKKQEAAKLKSEAKK